MTQAQNAFPPVLATVKIPLCKRVVCTTLFSQPGCQPVPLPNQHAHSWNIGRNTKCLVALCCSMLASVHNTHTKPGACATRAANHWLPTHDKAFIAYHYNSKDVPPKGVEKGVLFPPPKRACTRRTHCVQHADRRRCQTYTLARYGEGPHTHRKLGVSARDIPA